MSGNFKQFMTQVIAVVAPGPTPSSSPCHRFILDKTIGLRVEKEDEIMASTRPAFRVGLQLGSLLNSNYRSRPHWGAFVIAA